MKLKNLKSNKGKTFSDVYIIEPDLFCDGRGFFYEKWNKKNFKELTDLDINFVQDNESKSQKGVVRGLHYQMPPKGQIKLVSVIKGSIYDVVVDLRMSSKTFKDWGGIEINATNKLQLFIPIGYAHGFKAIKEDTIVQYKVSNYWDSSKEISLLWNDNDIKIKWPEVHIKESNECISKKDINGKSFKEIFHLNEIFK